MLATLYYMLWIEIFGVVMLYNRVFCTDTFRSSHVKVFESCSLAEATNQTMLDSADCKYACLAKQYSGSCVAYQWDAESRTCRLQETLNIIVSSSVDTVGVLMDADESCSDDSDCPPDHVCHEVNTGCGKLGKFCHAVDCAAILAAIPSSPSGVYNILAGTQYTHKVWCDMDTDGGGWTVFLKRLDGSVDFYQDLAAYQQGFGEVDGEYWLGLDVLHALTSSKTYQLRADISDWNDASVYSQYQSMVVAGESNNYRLSLGAFSGGEGGDALTIANQMEFSTKDADRDIYTNVHCARRFQGGFWYRNCFRANPTGKYYHGGVYVNRHHDGMQWRSWPVHDDIYYSMKTVEMKLRP